MSQFVVSARKYRPSTFDEVVGQNHVAKTLKNALQTDKLAHAFLFCGPRGVGKTTCARILAKVINCQQPKDKIEPCHECSSCKSFNDNASFNIFELDAASNNSVDHIRHLTEQVRFQPQQGTHKVFIIDEVHMLSTQAFNAFLKTLEEPPPYAIFILATTEKHKILPTILSRCQIFDFKRIQPEDVVHQLKMICVAEQREAEDEALHQIAQKADGAMRDALSIFDKISSASQGKITYQDVVINLNLLDYDYFFRVVDGCLRQDLTDVLVIFDEIIKNGFDVEMFLEGLASHLRDILVSKDKATIHLIEGSDDLKKRYFYQSQACSTSFLLSSLNILNECGLGMPRANNKRLQIELALSKLVFLSRLVETDLFTSDSQEKKSPELTKEQSQEVEYQNITKYSPSIDSVPLVDLVLVEPGSEKPATLAIEPTDPLTNEGEDEHKAEAVEVHDPAVVASYPTENLPEETSPIIENAAMAAIAQIGLLGTNLPSNLSIKKSSTIESIKANIKREEDKKLEAQDKLNIENLKKEIFNYIGNHNSPSFQSALKGSIVTLNGSTIDIVVPTGVGQNHLTSEIALMDRLRDAFGTPTLTMRVIVDASQFPDMIEEKVERTYFTSNEALQELKLKNPNLTTLIERLQLKIDDGR